MKTPFLFVSQTETSKLFIYFIDIFYKNKYNSFINIFYKNKYNSFINIFYKNKYNSFINKLYYTI